MLLDISRKITILVIDTTLEASHPVVKDPLQDGVRAEGKLLSDLEHQVVR
jgi:hypothetical protein